MRIHPRILAVALSAALCTGAIAAHAAPQAEAGAPLAEPSKALYWQGHEALGRNDWGAALENFRELERQLGASKTEATDAAIYWQAYALAQARRSREAGAEVERLRRAHPSSVWLDDADALLRSLPRDAERGQAADAGKGDKARDRDEREEDALMALDALLSGGNQKAVPILQRVLAGNHSDRVKERAIFVLSQIDPGAAESALESVLTGNASSKMKAEAIRMIAAGGRASSLDRLLPIYRSSTDAAVRRGVLDAFLIGDRGDLLMQVIEIETDARRRRDAIEKLGAMGKSAELKKLYAGRSDPKDRRAILNALGIAGARGALLEVARSETDVELRAEAIQAIGIAGGKEAPVALLGFYQPNEPERIRKAVIEALMISDATRELVQLYRQETDPEMRRKLLTYISSTDSDAALELIDEALRR
jgi:HEAT repeat protein